MRRSICYCEPATALAGESNTWHFVYTCSSTLPKGTKLKFDLISLGRDIDWEIPTANVKKGKNVIYAVNSNGKIIQGEEVESKDRFTPEFLFVLPGALEAGASLTFVIGAPPGSKAKEHKTKNGNRAQCTAQRRRSFHLYVDPTGKGRYDEPEVFNIDIRGNALKTIRILTPSFVARNKRFDAIVRFEDAYANLTNSAPSDTMVELSHEHLRENLKWKLFIPETGFIALPNLYFNEPGVYTIQLLNTKTKEIFRSAPIRCFPENNRQLFWGLLHGESERYDATENIENCLRHMRDDKAMNFFASSPFESTEETPNEVWKSISQNIAEFDETDRFTTLLGFQWEGKSPAEGLRQLIYAKDNKPILRKKDQKYDAIKKIYRSFSPKELLSIPSFTMGKGIGYDFNAYEPQFERIAEIYNAWGSSECTKKEGNTRPISSPNKKGIQEYPEGALQKALQRNCRFGFVAGGLDDRGVYAGFFEGDQEQYFPGLTAIIAPEHSRTAILEALYNRSCYATTGERIIVGLYLAGAPMGSELNTTNKPGLQINRHLSGYVAGTAPLESVEIICNGEVITSFTTDNYFLDFVYDDNRPLEKAVIQTKNKGESPFLYYYLRVTQEDGHMAWSSPIWVDLTTAPKAALKRTVKVTKAPVKPLPIEIEEDEEDEDEE